jgi:predicted DNA-binding ribbon-helix-helix protein
MCASVTKGQHQVTPFAAQCGGIPLLTRRLFGQSNTGNHLPDANEHMAPDLFGASSLPMQSPNIIAPSRGICDPFVGLVVGDIVSWPAEPQCWKSRKDKFSRYRGTESRYDDMRPAFARRGTMKSPVIKRSIIIDGHKTSVSLEDAFWSGLKEIAQAQGATLSQTVTEIDRMRQGSNLSSAIRLFVLDWARSEKSGGHRRGTQQPR